MFAKAFSNRNRASRRRVASGNSGYLRTESLERREVLDGSGEGVYLNHASLYTDINLRQSGLVGSYINQTLASVESSDDWRSSQSVAGTRVDVNVEFLTDGWGRRSSVGLTGGTDANWENFSVQWDGVVRVTKSGQRLATVSDDGSRMWIDLNRNGSFSDDELYDNAWGGFQGMTTGERTQGIPAGVYPIRIQYYEQYGANSFALASSPYVPRQFVATPDNPVQVVKVLVINFDPRVPSEGNQKLHEVFNWSNPVELATQFEHDIEWATGGGVDIQIVEWRERDAFPIFEDGFRYNPDEYVQLRRNDEGWAPGTADFRELVEQEQLVPLVNSGAVDELWLFGDHYFSLLGEAWMAGPNSFFINGPTMSDVGFDRAISGYGFNYERSVGEMLHNLGHRIENHGQRAFGAWNLQDPVTAWDRYSSNSSDTLSGPYGVGTVHFPANADSDYDYANTRSVLSTSHDFRNYPNLGAAPRRVDRDTWAFGPAPDFHRDYLNWYLAMMPRNEGVDADGRAANWSKYIWDFNSYEAETGLPRQSDAFASSSGVKLPGGRSLEFTVRYYDVEGVHVQTIGHNDVSIVTPGNVSISASFTGVTRSVKTTAGSALTVTYRFTPPGGSWDESDNGTYRIVANSGKVKDVSGNAFSSGDIGQFEVAIPLRGQIEVREMLASGAATVSHTSLDIGPITNLFDNQSSTLIRTPNLDPAEVTLSFTKQQTVNQFRVYFSHTWGDPAYRYSVEVAQTLNDLESRSGSYQKVISLRGTPSDEFDDVRLPQAITGRVFRLTATRLTGDDYVHINEWQLIGSTVADNAPPTVRMEPVSAPVSGTIAQFLTIVYEDESGIRVPTIGTGDIVITGPKGISITPVFFDIDSVSNGKRREATYWFVPPGGKWGPEEQGRYLVVAKAGGVTDIFGQSQSKSRVLGTFRLDNRVALAADGSLTVNGTRRNNTIAINPVSEPGEPEKLLVTMDGVVYSVESDRVSRIVVHGLQGNDKVTLNAAVTQPSDLYGGKGNDSLIGGSGNDYLVGGPGNDMMAGRSGNDTYLFERAFYAETDVVNESLNAGSDTLNFAALTTDVTLLLSSNVTQAIHRNRKLVLNGGDRIENVTGGAGNDILIGNGLNNKLLGNNGHDVLIGNGGDDILVGGSGRDILTGGKGRDTLRGGDGEDILVAGRTTSDNRPNRLADLQTAWTSRDSYATRIRKIRNGVGASKASLKADVNVLDDAGADDSSTGGGSRDWFFYALDDVMKDLVTGEALDVL